MKNEASRERLRWRYLDEVCGTLDELRATAIVTDEVLAAVNEARKTMPDARLAWLSDGKHVRGCTCGGDEPLVDQRIVIAANFCGKDVIREID